MIKIDKDRFCRYCGRRIDGALARYHEGHEALHIERNRTITPEGRVWLDKIFLDMREAATQEQANGQKGCKTKAQPKGEDA